MFDNLKNFSVIDCNTASVTETTLDAELKGNSFYFTTNNS